MAAKGPTPQSDIPRWVRTSKERPRWDERNRMIAAYVPPGSSVLDIGAGAQTLSDHLPPGCVYQPADIVPGPGVLLCDLDAGRWPEIQDRYDIVVCSGVLEYLQDVPGTLARLARMAARALVTYSDRGRGQRIDTRVRQGWHSHLTLPELRAALDGLDADWRFLTEWRGHVIFGIDFEPGLPPLRDGDALIEEAAWESSFARLETYACRTRGARVPTSLVEDGVGLGAWVQAQRRMRRRGTLSARRTARLEAVPGWSWRTVRSAPAAAPEVAEEPGLGRASLRPLLVEADRRDWMAKAAQGDPVLDMTCGQGTAAVALARAGLQVVGFDRDAEALEQVRARLSEETPETQQRLTLVSGASGPLPLPDKGFDTVLLADAGDQTGELLAEARRLLRPRGRIVLTSLLEVSARGLQRPRASLGRLVKALGDDLRPVQIVDGERWVGVVAVFGDPRVSSGEPWTALLEVTENRLARLGDAYADRVVLLDETRERERELAVRLDEAVAGTSRHAQEAEARRREADAAAARQFDEITALEREAARAQERAEVAAGAGEELREQLAATHAAAEARLAEAHAVAEGRRAEDAQALERERERGRELAERLGAARAERAAEQRSREELAGRVGEERERREELAARLTGATALAEAARLEAATARERVELVEAQAAADAAVRDQHLREVREDGRALVREAERHHHRLRVLEAELEGSRAALAQETGRAAAEATRAVHAAVERDAHAARLRTLEAQAEPAARRIEELDAELVERDRRLAQHERRATQRDRDATRTLEAVQAKEAALRGDLEAVRGKLRVTAAREERAERQLESLRSGRAYRFSARWWKIRRRVRHPLGGGGAKKTPQLPPAE